LLRQSADAADVVEGTIPSSRPLAIQQRFLLLFLLLFEELLNFFQSALRVFLDNILPCKMVPQDSAVLEFLKAVVDL
jgi:hypothetical protein